MDFFTYNASLLCKQVTELLNSGDLPEGRSEQFLFAGKCLRTHVRNDAAKLYDLMEGPLKVQLFNTDGSLV